MPAQQDHESVQEGEDRARRDGFAAMAILALTVVFIAVVLVAII